MGKWPAPSVSQAREAASVHHGTIAAGGDPQGERRRRRREPTLDDLWESYLELHAKPQKKTWQDDERMYKKYLVDLHGQGLSAITRSIVAEIHGRIGTEHGKSQANQVKFLLSTMFNKAAEYVGYQGPNPCQRVAKFPSQSRERYFQPAEMEAFFRGVAAEDAYWQAFFLLCLFTGSRRGNVAAMEWQEIDLANAVWHIPGSKTKNKRPASIALCEPAVAILAARQAERLGSKWVFPAFLGQGHLSDPRKAWHRILTAMRSCPKCGGLAGQGELANAKAWRKAAGIPAAQNARRT